MSEKFVPVYARVQERFTEVMTQSVFLRLRGGLVEERDGVTGALIGVYELRSVG